MSITLPPLPEPDGFYLRDDDMLDEIERLRERVCVLEGALHHVDDCLSINDYGDYVLLDRFDSEIVTNALEK